MSDIQNGTVESLTKPFDEMAHGDFVDALNDLRIEAGAAVQSGDAALQKWGRSIGILATILHAGLTGNDKILAPPAVELEPKPEPELGPQPPLTSGL